LSDGPAFFDRWHSFDEYIYTVCPNCGKRDFADERRFFFVLGPRGLYVAAVIFMLICIGSVIYFGFR